MGLILVREEKHVAQGEGFGGEVDIIQAVTVRSNIPIEDPRKVSFLKLKLKRIPLTKFQMNDGRQKLYGNVGYGVIEANIKELLRSPVAGTASWC